MSVSCLLTILIRIEMRLASLITFLFVHFSLIFDAIKDLFVWPEFQGLISGHLSCQVPYTAPDVYFHPSLCLAMPFPLFQSLLYHLCIDLPLKNCCHCFSWSIFAPPPLLRYSIFFQLPVTIIRVVKFNIIYYLLCLWGAVWFNSPRSGRILTIHRRLRLCIII